MSKPKKGGQSNQTGLYKADSVRDVAESLGITNLADSVASALASDVEYRIHQVVEEAARFMRHARRTTMTTDDINQALRVLNIEPLYGHSAHNNPPFRRALPFPQLPAAGPVYFVEDEEIDFDRVLREERITIPKSVSWTAHWLAVEGVQPLVPENPPAIPKDVEQGQELSKSPPHTNATGFPPTPPSPPRHTAKKQQQQQQQLVKQVLSKELQLYYTRLTMSLLPPSTSDHAKRTAALASLRNDAGLQALLPYLIRWIAEGVTGALKDGGQSDTDGRILEILLDVVSAILENETLFIEPYLHQILPPVLSTLLHSSLPPSHSMHLRTSASQTLSRVLTQHSTTYPSLSPRIMKTLLLALISPEKGKGTREGAIRGLVGIGKEAVRKGLVEGGGVKVVGSECISPDSDALVDAVLTALKVLQPPSDMPESFDMGDSNDAAKVEQLRSVLGDFFAERMLGDKAWALGVLGNTSEGG